MLLATLVPLLFDSKLAWWVDKVKNIFPQVDFSGNNIYLENNQDDAIDWTEGWSGTIDNAYVVNTDKKFSTVVEGDKVNNNPKINKTKLI